MEDLDIDALVRILKEPKNALIKQYQYLFSMEDVKLIFTDDGLKAIAQKAVDYKTGARGLRSIMERILMDTMFELPSLENVVEVQVTKETVNEGSAPLLVYAERDINTDEVVNTDVA